MAFRDENGKITIDELAAGQDIRNLRKAKEDLDAAVATLKEMAAVASEFSGNTGTAITESSLYLQKQIQLTLTTIDTTIENIDTTIKKYQAVDRGLRDMISGTNA